MRKGRGKPTKINKVPGSVCFFFLERPPPSPPPPLPSLLRLSAHTLASPLERWGRRLGLGEGGSLTGKEGGKGGEVGRFGEHRSSMFMFHSHLDASCFFFFFAFLKYYAGGGGGRVV